MEICNHPNLQKYCRSCPAGTIIMTEGDQADSLYILSKGKLDVIKGGKKIYEISEPGSFFGELSFLLGTVRIASVISATEETSYLCLPNQVVNEVWQEFPDFARDLARNLALRLHETTNIAQGFREFCDQMPDAVIMTNANCEVMSWNQAAEKLYGRHWHRMRNKSIEEIYDNQAVFKQFMAELNSTGAISEKNLKINHPDKDWFFVSTSTTILRDPNGKPQGYLFLGRDATSLQKLEKKQRRFKKWLLPMVVVLALLTGWLVIRQLTMPTRTTYLSSDTLSCDHLIARLTRDTAALELALSHLLTKQDRETARMILSNYFSGFHPELSGIKGVLLLDSQQKVLCSYFPARPESRELAGQLYTGSKFSEDLFNLQKSMDIFLVSRPEIAGGQGVEMLIAMSDQQGWLAFRLDMDLIKSKYACDINNLAKAIK